MRRYIDVIWGDITAPFREWSWRGVSQFVLIIAALAVVVLVAMFVLWAPWYAIMRFGLGYERERAAEITAGVMIVQAFAVAYIASVVDRASGDRRK